MVTSRQRTFVICLITLFCTATRDGGPYANGRLVNPAFIELAGTKGQIKKIKKHATAERWRIECNGRVDQYFTMRIKFPAGTKQESIEQYFYGDMQHPISIKSNMIYDVRHRSRNCILWP